MLNKLGTTEDMVIYHENGNLCYEFTNLSNGLIKELTFDKNGLLLNKKNSDGITALFTRDEYGHELAYKDSNGYYRIKDKDATQEEYEAFIKELEKKQIKQQIKQQMKKYIINCILVMALFYLLIAFVTLEIDFRLWDAFTRGMLGFFGTLLAMCISATIIAIKNNK